MKSLRIQPNSYQTWQEFLEYYVTSMETHGNFYAELKYRAGELVEILPIKNITSVSPVYLSNGDVEYTYATNSQQTGKEVRRRGSRNKIFHVRQNTQDGLIGISPIARNAGAIGVALTQEQHNHQLMKDGGQLRGVLTTDQSFGEAEEADESIARLKKQWNELYSGVNNVGNTAVLEFGMKYEQIALSSVDMQLLEARKYSREQIASIFRVPLHMLGDTSAMKYNTVGQTNTAFFRDGLMPLVTKFENQLNLILGDKLICVKLNERDFVRGDAETTQKIASAKFRDGIISQSEYREACGEEHDEQFDDKYCIDSNNTTIGTQSERTELVRNQIESSGKEQQGWGKE
jgi:HK97 family phage portal protein